MNEIDYFKVFVLCSGDVTTDVDHLHVKKLLVDFSYIIIEDKRLSKIMSFQSKKEATNILWASNKQHLKRQSNKNIEETQLNPCYMRSCAHNLQKFFEGHCPGWPFTGSANDCKA
jgi:hypothetical protein